MTAIKLLQSVNWKTTGKQWKAHLAGCHNGIAGNHGSTNPWLKAVMVAGKKPNTDLKITDLGLTENELRPCIKPSICEVTPIIVKNIVISDGNAAAKVTELIGHLKKEGVL